MTSDGTALIARIDAAERATLLGRQRAAELESTKKGLQLDLVKLTAANTRQQQICRELQQAMKALGGGGGEGNAEEEDEATRRDELASKFDNTIGDIGDIGERMGGQEAEVERLVADNERSSARLASFRSQHEAVVKHQAAEAHTRDLQVRLAAAQLCEAEQHLHEQAQRCRLTEVHLQSQRAAEEDARGQVAAYHARFGQLHETLEKSAEVFTQLREQAAAAEVRASEQDALNATLEAKVHAAGSRGRGEAARERCEALRRQIAQLGEDTAAATASARALQTERALKLSEQVPPAVD